MLSEYTFEETLINIGTDCILRSVITDQNNKLILTLGLYIETNILIVEIYVRIGPDSWKAFGFEQ
jgi:hypothetical protein